MLLRFLRPTLIRKDYCPEPTRLSSFGSNNALNLGSEIYYVIVENGWCREVKNISAFVAWKQRRPCVSGLINLK